MTLTVIVEPVRLALTTTPSKVPSACDETTPVSAAAPCAPMWLAVMIMSATIEIPREPAKIRVRITLASTLKDQ